MTCSLFCAEQNTTSAVPFVNFRPALQEIVNNLHAAGDISNGAIAHAATMTRHLRTSHAIMVIITTERAIRTGFVYVKLIGVTRTPLFYGKRTQASPRSVMSKHACIAIRSCCVCANEHMCYRNMPMTSTLLCSRAAHWQMSSACLELRTCVETPWAKCSRPAIAARLQIRHLNHGFNGNNAALMTAWFDWLNIVEASSCCLSMVQACASIRQEAVAPTTQQRVCQCALLLYPHQCSC